MEPIMTRTQAAIVLSAFLTASLIAGPAAAELPDAMALLKDLGLGTSEAEKAKAGEIVPTTIEPSNERELTTGLVFLVKGVTPGELVKEARTGMLDKVDPNTLSWQLIEGAPGPGSFAKLALAPDGEKRAKAYVSAKPGQDLNLSPEEIASFEKLGSGAAVPAVEEALRKALLARLTAYRSKGLAGIAPYARSGGKQRAPAEDLRSATKSVTRLEKWVPGAYRHLLDYPGAKPPGTDEVFRWSQINAHGVPTLVLTHSLYVPDGDAWVVTGFGGGAKRSIGSKMLASQLEEIFQKVAAKAGQGAN
jgi:hypothetical protein